MIKQIIKTKILIVLEWKMENSLVSRALQLLELTFAKIIIMGIDVKLVKLNPKLIIATLSVMMQEKDGKVSLLKSFSLEAP